MLFWLLALKEKKSEEMQKDERKRKRQEEKEQKALQPKRPRGRPKKNESQKDASKKDEPKKDESKQDESKKDESNKDQSKGKGKRSQAEPMCKTNVKGTRVEKPVPAKSSCTATKSSKRSTSSPAKAWKASPMALKTRSKSSPSKEGCDNYQSSDARTQRAMDALKELHGVMKKVSGFSMPDLKTFSKKCPRLSLPYLFIIYMFNEFNFN